MNLFFKVPPHQSHGSRLAGKKTHNKTKNCDGDEIPNKFQKQTLTSRGTKLSLNSPILSEIEVEDLLQLLLIFIHHKSSINEVKVKVTQTNVYGHHKCLITS